MITFVNTNIKETSFSNIVKIAIPIALQQLLTAGLQVVDTAFIVSLGDVPTTAVGASGKFFFLVNIIMFGFCSGMMVLASQYWGINDRKSIKNAFGLGLSNLLVVGFVTSLLCFIFPNAVISLFTDDVYVRELGAAYIKIAGLSFLPGSIALTYSLLLRSTANVGMPLAVSFVSVSLNTVLNYLLIFGHFGFPRLEVRGAAIATLIASVTQAL